MTTHNDYTMTNSINEINKAIQIIKQFQSQLETINADHIYDVDIVDLSEQMDDVIADLESELSDYVDDGPEYDGAGFTYQDNLDSIEYVVVSTSYRTNETYVFPGNSDGEITSFSDLGGLAERWGHENWESAADTMEYVFGDAAKDFQIVKQMWGNGPQYLYKRVKGDA